MFHDNVEGKVDTTTTVVNLKFSYGDYRLPGWECKYTYVTSTKKQRNRILYRYKWGRLWIMIDIGGDIWSYLVF